MVCIYCSGETQVTNSRPQKRSNQVWRRRKCRDCHAIFSTFEAVETTQSLAFDKLGKLEPFSRDSLLLSVYDSLRHRKTAISDATALTATIFSRLLSINNNGVIKRDDLVKASSEVLQRFDPIAATHYSAFHPL